MTNPRSPRSWRDAASGPKPDAKAKAKRPKAFKLLVGIAALVGVIAFLIRLIQVPPKPYFLPICFTEYDSLLLPLNAQAGRDRQVLLDGPFFEKGKQTSTATSQERRSAQDELKQLAQRKEKETVVCYLSAHALCDPQGKVWLLPASADIDDPQTWMALDEVLDALKQCPSRQKLLILDTMRLLPDPRLGVLAEDVAEQLRTVLEKELDDHTAALCACGPGEVPLYSQELQQSIFGYYLNYGLLGWADRTQDDDNDVTVKELARFVQTRVSRWARENRGTQQTPFLVGKADFSLRTLGKSGPDPRPELSEAATAEAYPGALKRGWELRQAWWDDPMTLAVAPRVFQELEATLLRAEQRWRSGVNLTDVEEDLNKSLDKREKGLKDRRAEALAALRKPEQGRSLALAAALAKAQSAKKPDQPTVEALRDFLQGLDKPAAAKAGEADKARPLPDKLKEKFKEDHFTLAWTAIEAALELPALEPQHLHALTKLLADDLESRRQPRSPRFVETLFLHRLDDLANQFQVNNRPWTADAATRAQSALRLVWDAERVASCDPRAAGGWDPRVFPWIQKALDQAAQQRHDAEVLLFSPGFASSKRTDELLQRSAEAYRTLQGEMTTLHQAYRTLDEALIRLPALFSYLMRHPPGTSTELRNWREAIQAAVDLQTVLANPPANAAPSEEVRLQIRSRAQALQVAMQSFTDRFLGSAAPLRQDAERSTDAAVAQRVDELLELPWLPAEGRKQLWEAEHKLALAVHKKTDDADERDDRARHRTEEGSLASSAAASAKEQELALQRAGLTLDLLRLGGVAGVDALKDKLEQAARNRDQAVALRTFAQDLRQASGRELRKQLEQHTGEPVLRDRLSRIVQPFDPSAAFERPDANPALARCREPALVMWQWQAERFLYEKQDLQNLAAESRQRDLLQFYDDAAEDYLRKVASQPSLVECRIADKVPPAPLEERKRDVQGILQLTLTGEGAGKEQPRLEPILPDDQWLEVTPSVLPGERGSYEARLNIHLKEGAENASAPAPKGFLVKVVTQGRSFHHLVEQKTPAAVNTRPRLIVSLEPNPKGPGDSRDELLARPNTQQPLYIHVWNPTSQDKSVRVQILSQGSVTPLVDSREPVDVKRDGGMTLIPFPSLPAPRPGDKTPDLPELKGPLVVRLVDAKNPGMAYDERQLKVTLASPKDYVEVQAEPGVNQLVLKVKPREVLHGEECRIEAVLLKDLRSGERIKADGLLPGIIKPETDREIRLTIRNPQFEDLSDEGRRCFLAVTVDGYERAFLYQLAFSREGRASMDRIPDPLLVLRAPSPIRAGTPCPVRLLVANAPATQIRLEVVQDRGEGKRDLPVLEGERRKQVFLAPSGQDGTLVLKTSVKDWEIELVDTNIPDGRWNIQARMLANGKERASDQCEVVSDASKPEGVRFLSVGGQTPSRSTPGGPPSIRLNRLGTNLRVEVEGKDPQSGIKDVVLFFGEPEEDKRPKTVTKVFRAARAEKENDRWSTSVFIPADLREERYLTVEFVNGVDDSKCATVVLLPPEAPQPVTGNTASTGPKTGRIRGRVTEGGLPQPDLVVTLRQAKGLKEVAAEPVQTNPMGMFEFADLPPGEYQVLATKKTNTGILKASKVVTVKPGAPERLEELMLRSGP